MSEEIRVGDRFQIEVTVADMGRPEVPPMVSAPLPGGLWGMFSIRADVLHGGKRLPRPLRVGDRVHDLDIGEGDDALGTIIAIDGDEAWVRDADGISWLPSVSNLTLAEESAS